MLVLNESHKEPFEKHNSTLRRNEGSANLLEIKEKDLIESYLSEEIQRSI